MSSYINLILNYISNSYLISLFNSILWVAGLFTAAIALSGCIFMDMTFNSHKEIEQRVIKSQKAVPDAYFEGANGSMCSGLTPFWWRRFASPSIESLINRVMEGNLDIKAAFQRIKAEAALLRAERASWFPYVTGDFSISRDRRPGFFGPDIGTNYKGGISVKYELDLWGKIAHSVRSREFSLNATVEDRDALNIMITSETVRRYFGVVALIERKRLLKRRISLLKKKRAIMTDRFNQGLISSDAIYAADILIDRLASEYEAIGHRVVTEKSALLLLMGRSASEREEAFKGIAFSYPLFSAPLSMPETIIQDGVPFCAIFRRPDLKSSLMRVRAQDEMVAKRFSDIFPSINLMLSKGYTRSASSFGIISGQFWSIASSVAGVIFDAKRKRSLVEVENARLNQALIAYEKAVKGAAKEVEDAVYEYRMRMKRLKKAMDILRMKRELYDIKRLSYEQGNVDALSYLEAEDGMLEASMNVIDEKNALLMAYIGVVRAIGGQGWL